MNTKLLTAIFTFLCLLGATTDINAQAPGVTPKPVAFATTPKMTIAKLKNGEQDVYEVRGKASFTVTAANSDDTIAGTFNYTIPDDARQKIASISGKPLNTIPSNLTRKDTLAYFQEGTAAPVIHLELKPMEFDVSGVKLAINRVVLDINGRDSTSAYYSKDEMEALFTIWARQINTKRSRRGIISRMNKVINGEPD
jgi:hypothetical protein